MKHCATPEFMKDHVAVTPIVNGECRGCVNEHRESVMACRLVSTKDCTPCVVPTFGGAGIDHVAVFIKNTPEAMAAYVALRLTS